MEDIDIESDGLSDIESHRLKIDRSGRLVIPKSVRKALGIKAGETLLAWIDKGVFQIRTRRQVDEEIWERFRNVKMSSDELIRERRREAAREAAE